jgi:hypothetical protein
MNSLLRVSALLFTLLFVSCASNEDSSVSEQTNQDNSYQVLVYGKQDKLLYQVNGQAEVEQVASLISQKRVMMKKILPIFDTKIIIVNGEKREEWLFVKPNYLRLNSKGDQTIYELTGKEGLLSLLKSMQ